MTELHGKVALVTGGSRGIGAAVSQRLAQDGADVALTYLNSKERAKAVVSDIENHGRRGLAIRADSADTEAVVAAVNQVVTGLGRIDILVNNAGLFPNGPLEKVTRAEVDDTLDVHVRAVFAACQAAARHMADGSRIVSIGSSIATKVPYPGVSLYAMSKAALVGLTKGLAHDLGERGITANVVAPGSTDTDMNPADSEIAEDERALMPLGRYASPSDIAAAVAFLASDAGRNITGTILAVDGGVTA